MERNVMGEPNVYRGGVRREAELQRDREEARHGPAHGRQVLAGWRVRRRREVREGQRLRPARGGV